ncbi:MAG: tryptophan synthase subunit alpha [Nonlabens sp.]
MNNKLTRLFAEKPNHLLNIFFTAGYPNLDDTTTILKSLEYAGVDLVEIGIPFSDPLADGPTIQESSKQALENGMTIARLFNQLTKYKNQNPNSELPILLMGYFNPIMQYGVEKFLIECKSVGVDGVIIPDLPLQVYESGYKDLFIKYDVSNVFLVTPQTSNKRIREIDALSTAFIYAVSSASTTGSKTNFGDSSDYLARLRDLNLISPVLTGFNIKTKSDFTTACKYVNGAIIGSEFIRQITDVADLEDAVTEFVSSIKY